MFAESTNKYWMIGHYLNENEPVLEVKEPEVDINYDVGEFDNENHESNIHDDTSDTRICDNSLWIYLDVNIFCAINTIFSGLHS